MDVHPKLELICPVHKSTGSFTIRNAKFEPKKKKRRGEMNAEKLLKNLKKEFQLDPG